MKQKGAITIMPRYIEDDDYEEEFEDEDEEELSRRSFAKGRSSARQASTTRRISAILGGLLLVIAIAGFLWFIAPWRSSSLLPTLPIFAPAHPSTEQVPPLLAVGITLEHPSQAPTINQQQALLIASQLEPEAAANAQNTTAQYVLVSTGQDVKGAPQAPPQHAPTPALDHVPAWMVLYQSVPLQPNDPSVDTTPSRRTQHDLYVFLNADTGKELLAIWI